MKRMKIVGVMLRAVLKSPCFEKNAFKENTLPLTYFYLEMLLTEHKKKLSNDIHCVLEKLEIKR